MSCCILNLESFAQLNYLTPARLRVDVEHLNLRTSGMFPPPVQPPRLPLLIVAPAHHSLPQTLFSASRSLTSRGSEHVSTTRCFFDPARCSHPPSQLMPFNEVIAAVRGR